MDAVSDNRHVPLCIDLDGTLIATDSLWEGLVSVLIRRPWLFFAAIFWALSGKAVLKREVAARLTHEGADWPYREEVIARIKQAREAGQPVWLVTGAAESTATAIADHLGLFDRVLHSTDAENLTSSRKRDRLVSICGDAGFDYAGNSRDDLAVFDVARRAIIVAPDAAARKWGTKNRAEFLPLAQISPLAILKSIRVHQWLKNVLIAVPLVLNHEFADTNLVLAAIAAFSSFSFLASAVYIVNDISDLANDRQHPRKRLRPLASGAVSVPVISAAAVASACLLGCACKPSAATFLGRFGHVCLHHHGLHLRAQAQASGRRVHACSALHAANRGWCGCDRHQSVILASRLFDLLFPEPCPGQALCRAR
jgi:hypothetical protein